MPTIHAIEYDSHFEAIEGNDARMTVHSVFAHAVNLERDGEILSVVARQSYRAPHTATVPEETDFSQVKLAIGMTVRIIGRKIPLTPNYIIALPPDGSFSPQSAPIPTEATRIEGLKAFDHFIERLPATGGCLDGYRKRFLDAKTKSDDIDMAVSARIDQFLEAIIDHENLEQSIGNVVGAGKGLTPSGDDFLCGFLAMLGTSVKEETLRRNIVETIESLDLARKTTSISRQMLLDACKRHHPSPQNRLIGAFSGEHKHMRIALASMSEVGHTSGFDFAAGVATAARLFR